jgi:tetratricopeptide (TPR) repeat protein
VAGVPVVSPLVGREPEKALISRALDGASKGRGGALIISGPTGSGKTRLLDLLVDEASAMGFQIVRGYAAEGDAVPYSAFRRAVPGEDRRRPRGRGLGHTGASGPLDTPGGPTAVAGLGSVDPAALSVGSRVGAGSQWGGMPLAELLGPTQPREVKLEELPPLGAAMRLLQQFEEGADHAPFVLAMENLQWADPGSLALLRPLAKEARKRAMVLAVCFEVDENTKEEERREVESVARSLQRESGGVRLSLKGLSPEEAKQLAESILQGPLVLDRPGELPPVLARAGGNPFLLQEIVRAGLRDGWIARRGDGFRVAEPTHDLQVPALLRWWVHRRIMPLLPDDRTLLEAISVLGSEFDPRALANLLPEMAPNLRRGLERLERRHGLIHQIRPGLWKVEPAFLVAVIRVEMSGEQLRLFHRRAGEWQASHDPGSVERIAAHYVQAREPALAMPWLERAWQSASDRSDLEAAARFSQWGSELARGENHPDEDIAWRVRYGAALLQQGEVRRARKMLDEALSAAPEGLPRVSVLTQLALMEAHTGKTEVAFQLLAKAAAEPVPPADAGKVLVLVASRRIDLFSRSQQWEHIAEEAPRLLEHEDLLDERQRVRTLTALGSGLTSVNRFEQARSVLLAALSQSRRAGLVASEANVRTALGILAINTGDLSVARALFEQVADEWGRRGGLTNQAINTANSAETMLLQGDLETAERWMDRAYELAEVAGLRHLQTDMGPNRAYLYYEQGRFDKGEEVLTTLLADPTITPGPEVLREGHATLALIHLARGDPDRAWAEAQAVGEATTGLMGVYHASRAYAIVLAARGNVAEAEKRLLAQIEEMQQLGRRMDLALALETLGDIYQGQGRHSEARVRWTEALGLLRAGGALARAARVDEKRRRSESSQG